MRSAKSRRRWPPVWATRNTSSFARPRLRYDCALYWAAGMMYCTCGKCLQPTERNRQLNEAKYDVLSIPGCVIEKNPTHGAKHGPSMRQCMWGKPASTKVRIGRSFLRGSRNKSERDILDNFFEFRRYSMTVESAQWLHRSEAKMQKTVWRTCSNHWRWKQTYPSWATSQATAWSTIWRSRRIRLPIWSLYRWRFYPSSRTTHSSSSSHWQSSSDWKSTWSWDSWQNIILDWTVILSSLIVQRCHFACLCQIVHSIVCVSCDVSCEPGCGM